MKTIFFGAILFASLFITISGYSQDLIVSGITSPATVNGIYIKQSGTLYGYSYWKHSTATVYIYNDEWEGQRYWNIDIDQDDADSYFYAQSTSTPPTGLSWGALSGAGSVMVEYANAPEIVLKANSVVIFDGAEIAQFNNFTAFGSADLNTGTSSRIFTILNGGGTALSLTGSSPYITISGDNAGDFSITTLPSSSIIAGGSTTFQITFNPSAVGNRNAIISIANNDGNENPYDFAIQGRGFTPENMVVSGITNPAAANGTYIHQGVINNFEYWKHTSGSYYLYNDEYSGARYWNIDNDLNDDISYFYSADHIDDASPANVSVWTIATGSGATGTASVFFSNPIPNIGILGNSKVIEDNDNTPSISDFTNFGSLNPASGSITKTFTIQNSGNATLNLTGSSPFINISGTNSSDFSLTANPSSSIAAGGSTTFNLTFDPSGEGTRSAEISIVNNDSDENPYNFSISGYGTNSKNLIVSGITNPSGANGRYISQGINFQYQYWKHESGNYYIYNDDYSGSRYWNIDNNTDDASSYFFSNNNNEGYSPVSVTSWSAEPGNTGTPLIVYEGPEINIKGNSNSIADGDITPSSTDYTDFGNSAILGGTVIRTYTIENTGAVTLTLGTNAVTISGSASGDFSVTTPPASSVVAGGTTTFQVTFDPSAIGTRSATISVNNDDSDENPYDFAIQGTGTAPEISIQGNSLTILDGDNTPSASDYTDFGNQSVTSGNLSRTYTIQNTGNASLNLGTNAVTLSGGQSSDFSITTQPATTVSAGGSTTFTVQFDPSATGIRSTTINIVNDDADENPYNFTIQGTGVPTVSINDVSVNENSGNAVFTVSLSNANSGNITVDFATANNTATIADNDYTSASGTAIITSGNLSTTISVPLTADSKFEVDETFYINLSNASFGTITDAQGIGTITNDDSQPTVTLGISGSPLAENGGISTITATLSNQSYQNVTVNLGFSGTAVNTSDYTRSGTSITINAGSIAGSVTATGVNDALDEDDETIIIDISSVTNGTENGNQQVTATITDDDAAPSISINDVIVTEGDGSNVSMTFNVILSAASGKTITVDYSTTAGTATAGSDYTSITTSSITFNPGITSQNITVSIPGDLIDENDETLYIDLSNPVNSTIADNRGIGTITDNDPLPGISINDVTVTEGNSGTVNATFTISLSQVSGRNVTVNFATANNTATIGDNDYISLTGTATIVAGSTSATVSTPVNGDANYENNESFYLNLSNAVFATIADAQGIGTITNDDNQPTVTLGISDSPLIENGGASIITATLSNLSYQSVNVYLGFSGTATNASDYSRSGNSITVDAGSLSGSITITGVNDVLDEDDETIITDITSVTNGNENGSQQVTAIITDDDAAPSISINDVTVTEGDGSNESMTFNVVLSAASTKTITVDYSTSAGTAAAGTDYTSITTSTLTFNPGITSQNVSVSILGDQIDENDENLYLELSNPVNSTISDNSGMGTITDNDPIPSITINDVTVTEGNSGNVNATFIVNLSRASGKTITVDYETANNTAHSSSDYYTNDNSLTFAAGETSKTITLQVRGDYTDEENESFYLNLSGAVNATIADNQGECRITDDDNPPTVSLSVAPASISESSETSFITATLSTVSSKNISVLLSFSGTASGGGVDYTISAATISIPAGNTTGTATLKTDQDLITEGSETIVIDISGVTNGTEFDVQQEEITILDDDLPMVTLSHSKNVINEDGESDIITATLSDYFFEDVEVTIGTNSSGTATGDGTDYQISPSIITITAGNLTGETTLTSIQDKLDEENETIVLEIVSVINATEDGEQQVVCSIIDDDILPEVSTAQISIITNTSALTSGSVLSSGSESITDRGFVYSSSNNNPTIGEPDVLKESVNPGTGDFSKTIESLFHGTTYYIRAFASSSVGTSYGSIQNFTTKQSQTITFITVAPKTYGEVPFILTASSTSGLPVSFESSNPSVAKISTDTVKIFTPGNTTITARQEGNDIYAPAESVQQILDVNPKPLTILGTFSVSDKNYDGNLAATLLENNLSLSGIINNDTVDLNFTAEFSTSDPGTSIPVLLRNIELTGIDKNNYTVSDENLPSATASIIFISNIDEPSLNEIMVYPNPFTEKICFSGSERVMKVTIINVFGQKVLEESICNQGFIVTSQLKYGEYLVIIENNKGQKEVFKMIKNK